MASELVRKAVTVGVEQCMKWAGGAVAGHVTATSARKKREELEAEMAAEPHRAHGAAAAVELHGAVSAARGTLDTAATSDTPELLEATRSHLDKARDPLRRLRTSAHPPPGLDELDANLRSAREALDAGQVRTARRAVRLAEGEASQVAVAAQQNARRASGGPVHATPDGLRALARTVRSAPDEEAALRCLEAVRLHEDVA